MEYCSICKKPVKKEGICSQCNKKRKTANIVTRLSKKTDFKEKISKNTLKKIGIKDDNRIQHWMWSLEENNLIKKEKNNNYTWIDDEEIKTFIKKYGDNEKTIKTNNKEKTQEKCNRCNKILNTNKKTKYCEDCKKIIKTLKNITKIEEITEENKPFTIESLTKTTKKEEWQIEGIIYDLQEKDMIKKISKNEYEIILDSIEKYKKDNPKTITKEEITNKTTPHYQENNMNEIPVKIFSAPYNDKYLIYIKSIINIEKYYIILNILANAKEETNTVSIQKLNDRYMNILIEFNIEKDKKDEFIEHIQKQIEA